MDFFKRHYEKFILLGLFILFIGLMFQVWLIVEQTKNVSDDDLRVRGGRPDHQTLTMRTKVDKEDDAETKQAKEKLAQELKPREMRSNTALNWQASAPRNGEKNIPAAEYSDLVRPLEIAVCPYCFGDDDEEKRLIPTSAFGKKCPFCNTALKEPDPNLRRFRRTRDDRDGDGIKDEVERRYGLNPNDPLDALQDKDGDGFSNRYEIESQTSITDNRRTPPYWHRLRVYSIGRTVLPIKALGVNHLNQKDKKRWQLVYSINGKESGDFPTIGKNDTQTILIEGRKYKIIDIELDQREDPRTKKIIDKSKIVLEEVVDAKRRKGANAIKPDIIEMVVNEPVYSSDRRPIFEDSGRFDPKDSRKRYLYKPVRLGERIKILRFTRKSEDKAKAADFRSYIVSEVDYRNNIVILKEIPRTRRSRRNRRDEQTQQQISEYTITAEGEIPENRKVTLYDSAK